MVRPSTLVVEVDGAVIVPVASAVVMLMSAFFLPRLLIRRALLSPDLHRLPAAATVSAMSAKPICVVVSPAGMTWV